MTPAVAGLALALAVAIIALALLGRRARADLARARDRADRAEHARDAFFDLTTHELRSPLAAVLGYQELLQDGAYGELPAPAAEPLARIGRSGRHLLNLIDGVIELGRFRGGGLRPELEPVNLAVLVSGVAEAFSVHARDRGLEPRVDIDPNLPIITSDLDRLTRALDLLITSALKHPAGDWLAFEARTTGRDLDVRIHPTDLVAQEGDDHPVLSLGIRIAAAAATAELLGGRLEVEANDDVGTVRGVRFIVRDLGNENGESSKPGPTSPL